MNSVLLFPVCNPCPPTLSLSPGAFALIPAAGSYSQSDESRDHPEAAGTQLWSHREHQQFPQSVCAAAHQRQVGFPLLYLCPELMRYIVFCFLIPSADCSCSILSSPLVTAHPVLSPPLLYLFSSALLTSPLLLFSSLHFTLSSLHPIFLFLFIAMAGFNPELILLHCTRGSLCQMKKSLPAPTSSSVLW